MVRFLVLILSIVLFASAAFGQATTFAGLPGSPSPGDVAFITDGAGSATPGSTASGGGSNLDLVTWNGSEWVLVTRRTAGVAVPQVPRKFLNADQVAFDPSTSSLTADDVQGALEEAAAAGGATNLGVTPGASTVDVTSDTGADATLPAATSSLAGVMTAADRVKLDDLAFPVNTPVDTDGDGNADFYHFRASAASTFEDLFAAAALLVDERNSLLFSGTLDGSSIATAAAFDWDPTKLVELSAGTTLECLPGSRIYGPSIGFWQQRSTSTHLISNTPGASDVHVRGCFIEGTDFLEPFDSDPEGDNAEPGEWLTTSLFGGIHFDACERCSATGNTVRGSPHAGIFATNYTDWEARGNTVHATGEAFNTKDAAIGAVATLTANASEGDTALSLSASLDGNCAVNDWILVELDAADPLAKPGTSRKQWAAGWVEAQGNPITIRRSAYASGRNPGLPGAASIGNRVFCSEGDKHGIEFFCESGVCENASVEDNRASLIAGSPFLLRGVLMAADVCEDDSQVTCWHEGPRIRGNYAEDTGGDLTEVRGARNALIEHNVGVRTGGITFIRASQYCNEAYDNASTNGDQRECSSNTIARGNVFRDAAPNSGGPSAAGGLVRFNTGHDRVYWGPSNLIDGNVGGVGYAIFGDLIGSELHMQARNVASVCIGDGLNTGDPITRPLRGSANLRWCGLADSSGDPAFNWRAAHTADFVLDPYVSDGSTGQSVFIDPIGSHDIQTPTFRNHDITGHAAGYVSTGTEAELAELVCDPSWEGIFVISTDASSGSDCDFSSTTGGAESRCRCDGSAFVPYSTPSGVDTVEFFIPSGFSANGGGFFDGTIRNTPSSGTRLISSGADGASSADVDGLSVVNVTLAKGPVGMLSTDTVRGIDEHNANFTNLTVRGLIFDGIADADRFLGHPSGDYSGFSGFSEIADNETPSGACVSGAEYLEIDATGGASDLLCRDGAWVSRILSETTGASCVIYRDSDDAGDTACEFLNGVQSCELDTNGVCGDAT